jgi:hypothetical protein
VNTTKQADLRSDVVIGVALMLLFLAGLWASMDWPFRTALFRRLVTVAGAVFALLFVGTRLVAMRRRGTDAVTGIVPTETSPEHGAEDDEDSRELEYVYATVGRAAWARALGWVTFFVLLLPSIGLYLATAVFAFSYLRWCACRSWLFAATYAALLCGTFYLLLEVLLSVTTPEAVLW